MDINNDAEDLIGLGFHEIADAIAADNNNGNLAAWRLFLTQYAGEHAPARWSENQVIQRALSACVEELL